MAAVTAATFVAYTHFHPHASKSEMGQAARSTPFAILSPPSIRWTSKVQPGERGRLHLAFKVEGSAPLQSLQLQVTPAAAAQTVRLNKETHEIPTWLMGNKSIDWDGEIDLTGSLLAGQPAHLQIVAEDEDHRRTESETVSIALPEHHFSQPLAQALYTLRRSLQEEPQQRRTDTLRALAVLLQQRPTFEERDLMLLTLRSAAVRIALDTSEEGLQSSLDLLWHAALLFEENPSSNVTVSFRLVPKTAPVEKPE